MYLFFIIQTFLKQSQSGCLFFIKFIFSQCPRNTLKQKPSRGKYKLKKLFPVNFEVFNFLKSFVIIPLETNCPVINV